MGLYKPLRDVATEYIRWTTEDHPRIPIGYSIMDSRTQGGAAAGEVILFQARSQVGKTAFAGNVIVNNPDVPTAFFSLEMHGRYILARLAAMHADVPTEQVEGDLRRTGRSDALQRIVDDFPQLAIIDKPAMSLKNMAQAMEEMAHEWGAPPKLVVIDFLELIGGVPSLSAVEKIDGLTRKVKDFAREWDTVVLLLHQVGRGSGEDGNIPLSITSSRYGGEVSADYVLGAYRPCLRAGITQEEYMDERWHWYLQFLKTRGGSSIHPQGVLHEMNPETMRIREWNYAPKPLFAERAS